MKANRPKMLGGSMSPDRGPRAMWSNPGGPTLAKPYSKVRSLGLGANAADEAYRQHYQYAQTGKIRDNGGGDDVQKLAELTRGNGYSGASRKNYLKDGGRGAGRPIKHTRGRFPAQAAPDHGDHM